MTLELSLLLVSTISLQFHSTSSASVKRSISQGQFDKQYVDGITTQKRDLGEVDSDTNKLLDVLGLFFRSSLTQLKMIPEEEMNELLMALDMFGESFDDNSTIAVFVQTAVNIAKKFLSGGFYISPETAITIIQKGFEHFGKEPDSLMNNLTKAGYRTMKTVGNGVQNWGKVFATGVKTFKDLHSSQAAITNSWSEWVPIPYFSTVVKIVNIAIMSFFEVAQIGTKVGTNSGGQMLIDMGNKWREQLKEMKQRASDQNSV